MSEDFDARVRGIAALGEPIRRALYRYVVAQDRPVGRERAAAGVGVAHHVAKFHLDRLVADGLLDVEYARPPGRTGPGAGRPAKLYRRSARTVSVSLPDRRYDLAGQVMAEAITASTERAVPVADALREAAATTGRRLGAEASAAGSVEVGEALARYGYEPRPANDTVVLANCPFDSLAQAYRDLVCGMNLDLVAGILDGLGREDLRARLDPGAGGCCVTIARC